MTQFLLALQFLSVIPVRISKEIRHEDLPTSLRYYPLVGCLLGGLSALAFQITLWFFSPGVAVVVAVITLILLSGGLHLDGLADMCDGFYDSRDRQRILEIMKDPRSGAMAVIGVFCVLALKIALIANLDMTQTISALIFAPAVGRWSMVWLCNRSTYARTEGGTGSDYIGHVDRKTYWIATMTIAVIASVLFGFRGWIALAAALAGTWLFRRAVEKRIGGMTGDTLGACGELVEVLTLAVLSFHGAGS